MRLKLRLDCAVFLVLTLIALSISGPSRAQSVGSTIATTSPGGVPELVVTAQRRLEKLQDVPASVSAYSGSDLNKVEAHKLADIIIETPNVVVNQPYGGGGPVNFVIRGISSTDFSQNQSKPIAIYLDEGVKQTQLFETIPLFDVDRVEVLSGPQGTLYGKNATAGAVNIITKEPGFEVSGYLTGGYGNFNARELQGAVQAPLLGDVLAVRLAFTYLEDDGLFKNLTPGLRATSQTDINAERLTLLYRPNNRFKAVLRIVDSNSGGRNYTPLSTNINLSAYPTLAAVPGAERQGLSFYENQTFETPNRNIHSDSINLTTEWSPLEHYTITTVTTFDYGHWYDIADSAGLPINISLYNDTDHNALQFVQELRLASSLPGPFNWQAGLFASHDQAHITNDFPFYFDTRCGEYCDYGLGVPGTGIFEHNSFDQRRDSFSGYLRGQYEVLPGVQLTGGVRESYDELRADNYDASLGTNLIYSAFPSFTGLSRSNNFTNTSWEGGGNWKITPAVMAYVTYKQGYRTGALNAQAFFLPQEVNVAPPETAQTVEAGLKSTWFERALTLNAAIFDTDYQNQQVLNFQDGALQLKSVARSHIQGVELEGVAQPIEGVRLNADLGLLDPKYTSGDVSGASVAGDQIVNAARVTGNIGGDFTLMSKETTSLVLNLNGVFTSRVYFDVFDTKNISQGAFWLMNGRLSYWVKPVTFSLYANNLLGQHYIVYGLDEEETLNFDFLLRGAPRQFGVEATYRF